MTEHVVSRAAKYGRVPVSLLLREDVTGEECRLYAYLTTFDFKFRGEAWPGRERAAKDLGWPLRSLERHLSSLVSHGEIRSVQGGAGRPARIELLADVVHDSAPPLVAALPNPALSPAKSCKRTSIERELELGVTAAENGGPEPNITQTLVAGFADDYRAVCDGHDPPRAWRAAAGKAVKTAIADGETSDDIAACLGLIAREGKHPSTLQYVLSDMHANRPRRNVR